MPLLCAAARLCDSPNRRATHPHIVVHRYKCTTPFANTSAEEKTTQSLTELVNSHRYTALYTRNNHHSIRHEKYTTHLRQQRTHQLIQQQHISLRLLLLLHFTSPIPEDRCQTSTTLEWLIRVIPMLMVFSVLSFCVICIPLLICLAWIIHSSKPCHSCGYFMIVML